MEPRDEPKQGLFDYLAGDARRAAEAREHELRGRYDLDTLRARSTRLDYRVNLYLLDALERLFACVELPPGGELRAVDIGAKGWTYVTALERFWARAGGGRRSVELHGVEIDGHGVYPDLHSRSDHARAHARITGNPDVHYHVADFVETELRDLDAASLLYPFVTRYALLRWGLPLRLFRPRALFERAVSVLRPAGLLVVINQTAEERDRAVELATAAGAQPVKAVALRSRLVEHWPSTMDRQAVLFRA